MIGNIFEKFAYIAIQIIFTTDSIKINSNKSQIVDINLHDEINFQLYIISF